MKLRNILLAAAAVPVLASAIAFIADKPAKYDKAIPIAPPPAVMVAPGTLNYSLPGEFLAGRHPVDAPRQEVRFRRSFEIMTYQVSAAEYARCVEEGACGPAENVTGRSSDLPVTGVSFGDAMDYAKWLSRRTGQNWRLPTDEEWAFAAAERFSDDLLGGQDKNNPSTRWLTRYRNEAEAAKDRDPVAKPQGSYGVNSNGLQDLAGNVWEWTSTCYNRATLDDAGRTDTAVENCGVRVLGGKHRSYMSFFLRDGKSGGCAGGLPPDNLGVRLVKERPSVFMSLKALWSS